MDGFIFSFNPILILIGILLTCIAVYASLDLFTNMISMKSNHNFLFLGSSFCMAIGIWLMNFFGMLAIDMNSSAEYIVLISAISMFCSFILTFAAFKFLEKKKKKRNLYIGSAIIAIAVLVTHIIGMHSIHVSFQYSVFWLCMAFLLIMLFCFFAFWFIFDADEQFPQVWIKPLAACIITVAIGQGFLLVIKSSLKLENHDTVLSYLSMDGYWLPSIFLLLSIIVFGGLIIGSMMANKRVVKTNLYSKDIMSALDASSIVTITDPRGSITYVNDKFVEISKYTEEELVGKRFGMLNSDQHPKSYFVELWSTIEQGEIWKGELCNVAKDGTYYWVDTTIFPFLDKKQQPYQYVAIQTDITDRKKVEEELQNTLKELQEYKYALDQASIVAVTNAQGVITKVNDNFCNISKYTKDELIGSDHRILSSGLHSKEFFKSLWRKIGNGKVWKGEIRNKAKDGTYYWVETTIVPFLNKQNKPYQYLAIRNDITEKKKQEEILHRQDKLSALGQMAAGIAHEIRNPLTSMRGYTEFLLLDEEKAERKEHLEIILDEINRVNTIVEEFMMIAKPKSDLFAVKNIVSILRNTLALFAYEAKKKKVQIHFHASEEEFLILCDENRLKQVFLNLVKNSIEAMPDGGQLNIYVETKEKYVDIIVTDTGVGIPHDQLKKIGEPFYTTKETGTGLGLMISFKIIESHQGKIEIESEQNKGTSFKISLPFVEYFE
ncbi:PAS domain-containing protein [Bacillus massiliigorillae]|uniref:PAS domain-containing protein n=1 Tax=Bacillus massiliigorillae TaxID=1243664 RepID=UPI0003A1818F|nr:PAS domain-containing protein [Bacillus massiliigorillae]